MTLARAAPFAGAAVLLALAFATYPARHGADAAAASRAAAADVCRAASARADRCTDAPSREQAASCPRHLAGLEAALAPDARVSARACLAQRPCGEPLATCAARSGGLLPDTPARQRFSASCAAYAPRCGRVAARWPLCRAGRMLDVPWLGALAACLDASDCNRTERCVRELLGQARPGYTMLLADLLFE